jgi:hypothetical protein
MRLLAKHWILGTRSLPVLVAGRENCFEHKQATHQVSFRTDTICVDYLSNKIMK